MSSKYCLNSISFLELNLTKIKWQYSLHLKFYCSYKMELSKVRNVDSTLHNMYPWVTSELAHQMKARKWLLSYRLCERGEKAILLMCCHIAVTVQFLSFCSVWTWTSHNMSTPMENIVSKEVLEKTHSILTKKCSYTIFFYWELQLIYSDLANPTCYHTNLNHIHFISVSQLWFKYIIIIFM